MKSEHVARVFDVGELDSIPYIVMEFSRGRGSRAGRSRSAAPLPIAERGRSCDPGVRGDRRRARARHRASRHQAGEPVPHAARTAGRAREGPRLRHLEGGAEVGALAVALGRTGNTISLLGSPHYMSPGADPRSTKDVDRARTSGRSASFCSSSSRVARRSSRRTSSASPARFSTPRTRPFARCGRTCRWSSSASWIARSRRRRPIASRAPVRLRADAARVHDEQAVTRDRDTRDQRHAEGRDRHPSAVALCGPVGDLPGSGSSRCRRLRGCRRSMKRSRSPCRWRARRRSRTRLRSWPRRQSRARRQSRPRRRSRLRSRRRVRTGSSFRSSRWSSR